MRIEKAWAKLKSKLARSGRNRLCRNTYKLLLLRDLGACMTW